MTYIPTMPKKEVEKRKVWQDKIYSTLKKIKKQKIKIFDIELLVLPGVFAPIFIDTIMLADALNRELHDGESVLDLGTGSGIHGIIASGKASKVLSTDINPKALECAKLNVKKLKLGDKVEVLESNLFENIKEKFDLIIFNPPFRWFKPRDMLESGELDENYETLARFFEQVSSFLSDKGRVLLVFSTSGDINYLNFLIKKYKFKPEIINTKVSNGWIYYVYRLKKGTT